VILFFILKTLFLEHLRFTIEYFLINKVVKFKMGKDNLTTKNFRGYKQASLPSFDESLSRVGPKAPCGEYLRRYWHPVALSSDVSEIPKEIRILGEDLVIFKTTKNNIGLVHKNCPHRRASLAYGKTEEKRY